MKHLWDSIFNRAWISGIVVTLFSLTGYFWQHANEAFHRQVDLQEQLLKRLRQTNVDLSIGAENQKSVYAAESGSRSAEQNIFKIYIILAKNERERSNSFFDSINNILYKAESTFVESEAQVKKFDGEVDKSAQRSISGEREHYRLVTICLHQIVKLSEYREFKKKDSAEFIISNFEKTFGPLYQNTNDLLHIAAAAQFHDRLLSESHRDEEKSYKAKIDLESADYRFYNSFTEITFVVLIGFICLVLQYGVPPNEPGKNN